MDTQQQTGDSTSHISSSTLQFLFFEALTPQIQDLHIYIYTITTYTLTNQWFIAAAFSEKFDSNSSHGWVYALLCNQKLGPCLHSCVTKMFWRATTTIVTRILNIWFIIVFIFFYVRIGVTTWITWASSILDVLPIW